MSYLILSIVFGLLILVLLGLGLLIQFKFLNKRFTFNTVRMLSFTSIMLAFCIVAAIISKEFFEPAPFLKILSPSLMFVFLSGLILGPYAGGLIGLLADLVSVLIAGTKGTFFIGFSFALTFAGFIGGVCLVAILLFKNIKNVKLYIKLNFIALNVILLAGLILICCLIFIPNALIIKNWLSYNSPLVTKILFVLVLVLLILGFNALIYYIWNRTSLSHSCFIINVFILLNIINSFVFDMPFLATLYHIPVSTLAVIRLFDVPSNIIIFSLLLSALLVVVNKYEIGYFSDV